MKELIQRTKLIFLGSKKLVRKIKHKQASAQRFPDYIEGDAATYVKNDSVAWQYK